RRVVLVRERAAGTEDIARATSAAVARLTAAHAGNDPGPGPVRLVGLFPIDLEEVVDVAVALEPPRTDWETAARTARQAAGEVDVLPGGRFARATHVGPYDQMALTVHAVLAWCAERRQTARGPIREVYVSDPAVTCPEELVTHVMIGMEEQS
ncbi:GyrI-like domain-containing protein, partial [Nonomuraea antimicrobica]|uniref:GyrI-like domain-containing protein n=1 Tax=Nonomuraea antimicrobica TaxID=561173 RepID=UPI0031E95A2C